jgi:protein ImuA
MVWGLSFEIGRCRGLCDGSEAEREQHRGGWEQCACRNAAKNLLLCSSFVLIVGGMAASDNNDLRPERRCPAVLDELRRLLPCMEGPPTKVLPFGIQELDAHLPHGGLAGAALHEILPDADETPAALGFMAAILSRLSPGRPLLFISAPRALRDCGRLHGHGLNALGLDPARVILVEPGSETLALWAMEEALRSGAPAAVAGAIGKAPEFKITQRLQLAAKDAGLPLLLLQPAGATGSSAAATRWCIAAAEARRDRFGLITYWRWHLRLERCRNGRPGEWLVEWDHAAHRFSLAAALADTAVPRRREAHAVAGRSRRS